MEPPPLNKRTVAEYRCNLVHVDADSLASTAGLSFPNILIHASHASASSNDHSSHQQAYIRSGDDASFMGPGEILPLAWHPHKAVAASVCMDRVHIYDMTAFAAGSGPAGGYKNGTSLPSAMAIDKASVILHHSIQREVGCVAWRPRSGAMLAVGCRGGVAVWTVGGATRAPVAGSSAASVTPWMSFLRMPSGVNTARPHAMAWSPDGRLLAAASPDYSGLVLFDVALGSSVRVGAGFSRLRLLRWSPDGAYLLAGAYDSRFFLYETGQWRVQSWDSASHGFPLGGPLAAASGALGALGPSPPGWLAFLMRLLRGTISALHKGSAPGLGVMTNAYWAPSGRILLMSFEGVQQMVALHLIGEPPSLTAQFIPLALPDMALDPSPSAAKSIVDWAWDANGERLVVLLGGEGHPGRGCLAVFSTTTDPVVHARLLGYARPPPLTANDSGTGGEASGVSAVGRSVLGDWRLSTLKAFDRGSLFTLSMSNQEYYNLPLMYRGV